MGAVEAVRPDGVDAPTLVGCRLRLKRARQLLEELNADVDRLVRHDSPHGADIHLDGDQRRGVLVAAVPDVLPIAWGLTVGEILYHLRSSLDHLVWQLVLANEQAPSQANEFPIFLDPAEYPKPHQAPRKLRGVAAGAAARIQALQPYNTGPTEPQLEVLWVLHELNNIDKHRVLVLSEFFLKTARYQLRQAGEARALEGMQRGPLKNGAVLAQFSWQPDDAPDAKVEMHFELSFDVCLQKGPPGARTRAELDGLPLGDALRQMIDRVEREVLPLFDPYFPKEVSSATP